MNGRTRVSLVVPCFTPYDAVGNDVLGMYGMLRLAGYDARVVSPDFADVYSAITEPLHLDQANWQSVDDVLIYHHAVGWAAGEELLNRTRNKVAIRYHNITPPEFYARFSRNHYNVCVEGEKSTARLARHRTALFWGASGFNIEGLIAHGAPPARCRQVAPYHLTEELTRVPMDPATLGSLRDGRLNVLFVGGLRPNKGHSAAIEVLAACQSICGGNVRMIFAGSYDPSLSSYAEHIRGVIRESGLECDVMFGHSVSPSQLKTFYYMADVFLCLSEHEGFCVPLVEAMALRVPILACGRTAIAETVGSAGIVYDELDPVRFAGSIAQLREDPQLHLEVADRGRRRYEAEFHPEVLRRKFLNLVEEIVSAPPASPEAPEAGYNWKLARKPPMKSPMLQSDTIESEIPQAPVVKVTEIMQDIRDGLAPPAAKRAAWAASTDRLTVSVPALNRLESLVQSARIGATQVGSMPPAPPTFRGRIGAKLVRLVQRALFWYTPQLHAFHLQVFGRIG